MKSLIITTLLFSFAVANESLYQKECGSCHMAYQSELLPSKSWGLVMEGLSKHFGVDASLDEADKNSIKEYLVKDSDKKLPTLRGDLRKFISSIKDENLTRISEIPYFIKEHREIPKRAIEQDEVKSLAFCNKCHLDAQKGIYDEHKIKIPNFGRIDD